MVMQRRSLAGCGCGDPTRRRIIWRKSEPPPQRGSGGEEPGVLRGFAHQHRTKGTLTRQGIGLH
jgi:hypothetical protein